MKTLSGIMFATALTGTVVTAAESTLDKTHSDWQSRVVYNSDQIRFRAVTTYADAGDFVVLAMDRYPKDCIVQYATMNIVASSPAEQTFTTDALFGAIRVDENPIHNMSYTLTFQSMERVFFAIVTNFDGEDTLLDELRVGRQLRFKLRQGKDEYFLRFSLQGFAEAEKRTLGLCHAFNKDKPDEDYFKTEPKVPKPKIKDDKDYFSF